MTSSWPERVLVTGGAGFIGNALVHRLLAAPGVRVLNLDVLAYASAPEALAGLAANPRYAFRQVDVRDGPAVEECLLDFAPDAVVHLAAESHVDRSIDAPRAFLDTNVAGTFTLLEAARRYWQALSSGRQGRFRLVHVSTDEVFGALGPGDPAFTAASPYRPRSPYAASKAASDHYARAWQESFGLPTLVTNCCNNYGPWQYPEKFIPVVIQRALAGEPVPVYGSGRQVRDWLHVDDHAEGLAAALRHGTPGGTYLFGGRNERHNRQLAETICDLLDELAPGGGRPRRELITEVADRPGHDFRYAIDPSEAETTLGWRAIRSFDRGLRDTVRWYLDHQDWVEGRLRRAGGYQRQGLGATR